MLTSMARRGLVHRECQPTAGANGPPVPKAIVAKRSAISLVSGVVGVEVGYRDLDVDQAVGVVGSAFILDSRDIL
jgi:hypothetical protein